MITNYFDFWGSQQERWTGPKNLCHLIIHLGGAFTGPPAQDVRYTMLYSEKFNSKDAETVASTNGVPIDGFLTGEETELDFLISLPMEEVKVMFIAIGTLVLYSRTEFVLGTGERSFTCVGILDRTFEDPR